jgi:formylmethanofuran dehydrogenase subunit E
MSYSNDLLSDFARYDAEQEREAKRLPVCCECGEHIQDEYLYDIDGDLYCGDCMEEKFRKEVEMVCGDW